MNDVSVRVDHVFKKFSLGEKHDSLRDLIPALTRKFIKRATTPLTLKQREFWSLNDVSFEIKKGEAVAIIGHNGAGKSTMLKHLSGVLRPTSGTVEVNGRLAALIEVGAGFHQDLTGRENVYLNGVILGMSRAEVQRKFDEIVEFSGLSEFIDTPVKRYSSGMYARLGFSVAAHLEPEILIIDEVLSVGDATFQAKGIAKMRSVLKSGATVIFVSHNLRAVSELCPRAVLLKKGALLKDGATSEVIRAYQEDIKIMNVDDPNKAVHIIGVDLSSRDGVKYDFDSGERISLSVAFQATQKVTRLSCSILLQNSDYYDIFGTSSERLGLGEISLEPGESMTCSFDFNLHLAAGEYHFAAFLRRIDTGEQLDLKEPAVSIVVRADQRVFGSLNLYPDAVLSKSSRVATEEVPFG